MKDIALVSCLGVADDLPLLPHFLDHYLALGLSPDRIHVILNATVADDPRLDDARKILEAHGTAAPDTWIAPYTSATMWARRRDLQSRVSVASDWIVNADVDEFHIYPAPLSEITAWMARLGATCLQGPFIDRLAADGRLAPVAACPDLAAQFPVEAEAMLALGGAGASHDHWGSVKLMLHRGNVLPSRGGHHPVADPARVRFAYGQPLAAFPRIADPGFRFALPFRVDHFKWTEGLRDGLERRLATPGVSEAGREYGGKLLAYLDRNDGIDPGGVAIRTGADKGMGWRAHVARLRTAAAARHAVRRVKGSFERRLKGAAP